MKIDLSHVELSKGFGQIKEAITILWSTPSFILKHKLWKGFLEYKWVLIFSVIIASFFSYTLCKDIYHYFTPPIVKSIDIPTEGLDAGIATIESISETSPEEAQAALDGAKDKLIDKKEKLTKTHKPLFSGSLKFLLLIFLEVLIFYFAVRTNNIIKGEKRTLTLKDFIKAQKRMILVMGRKWLFGLLMYIFVSIVCGILGADAFVKSIMFFIYGYYLGFAFLDNYLEQYKFSLKNSSKCIQRHFGASAVFGVFASVVMNVPLLGPLVVPFICGIAATRYGHATHMEKFDVDKYSAKAT
jgi:hypothetical protein